ncbi:hypothetical protein CTAYLR_008634 [Chrysophaeum taylorii]|uniref:CWF21 domain-containing protein n=1 Tax=Chrysophaeum taylorii TaxID=2483200 RepID=A0AAD7XNT3_9STRA|nr:hypothetical protein CTAYLR_008634 [Chrysophaeum taylorii]
MYNGVGLRTVRGSGTNGYVQTNKAYVRPANVSSREWKAKTQAPANPQLLEHARKRAIEVKVYELRDVLEDQGLDESEIEKRCADLRASLREGAAPSKKVDTHAAAEIKARDDARIRAAFGIDPEKFVEGAAFDRELQEQRRQARKAQHERYLVENEKKAERDRLKALEREEQREKDRKAGDREEGEEIEEEREDRRRKRPINYEFDHTYVTECIERYPSKFRGILLAKPGGAEEIKALSKKGFTGVRLNPYLWANRDGEWIADADGRAIVEASADLKMPVGVMAFGGLSPLIDHVRTLASMRPDGIVVLDHFGFPREDPAKPPGPELGFDEQAWAQLLGLGPAYPNIYVKVSALFRVSREPPPHRDLEPRFREVLGAFGADRLLWGSDFPYVQQQGEDGYAASLDAVASWCPPEAAEKILGLTARALYRLPSSS